MTDWRGIDKSLILNDRALLKEFTLDYQAIYGKLNIGCHKCIDEAYFKMTNPQKMQDPDFSLKKKYEGTFWKDKPIRNADLTLEVALDLLKNHQAGATLFDIVPKEKVPTITKAKKAKAKK
jgi:hypothetical protein